MSIFLISYVIEVKIVTEEVDFNELAGGKIYAKRNCEGKSLNLFYQ